MLRLVISGVNSDVISGVNGDVISSVNSDVISGVNSDVISSVNSDLKSGSKSHLDEACSAGLTLVRLLSGVDPCVRLEVRRPVELSTAYITPVRLLTCRTNSQSGGSNEQ